MYVLKNCNDPELIDANFHADSSIQNIYSKYSPNDVRIILFTDKDIPHQEIHRMTDCISITKKKDGDKTPAYTINVQSQMASIRQSQVVDITPV